MATKFSRRLLMQLVSGAAMAQVKWPPAEGKDTPKICLGSFGGNQDALRNLKQVGVDYLLMGGPPSPWTEESLKKVMDQYKAAGMTVINMMIGGFNDVIWGRPGATAQIENVIKSIRAAGKVGLPVIEYNFYANRLIEGYKEEIGRGGAGYTAYDYEISKNLPPRDGVGTHTRAEQMKRAEGFLKAVIPEAEKANVRLALHPNDPPVPLSRGSEQIMATFEHWKQYLNLVKSPFP